MLLQTALPSTADETDAVDTTHAVDQRIAPIAELLASKASGTALLHPDGRVVYIGGQAGPLLGIDGHAAVQKPFFELLPPAAIAPAVTAFQQARAGITELAFALTADGPRGPVPLAVQFVPIVEDGALLAVTANITELASRHAVNAGLRGDFDAALEAGSRSVLTTFLLDGRGQCTAMDESWTRATGLPVQSAFGTGWLAAMPESDRQRFRSEAARAHQEHRGWRSEVAVSRANGRTVTADIAAAPVVDSEGHTIGSVGLIAFSDTSPLIALQPNVAPETSKPAAPQMPVAVRPDIASQQPSRPAPKLALPEKSNVGWNPVVKEGPTDPELLMDRIKDAEAAETPVDTDQPGVDKTTGLANKLLFAQHVASTVSRMQSDALTVSVSFIDLHGLDVQKAAVGTRVANDYLFLLAKRLEATIRSIEIAGRIDGNILGVLSINWLFADDLPVVASRLMGKLGEPLAGREGAEICVAMNLGMAVAAQGEDVNALFHRAWDALQRSKAKGSNEFDIDLGAQGK